MSAPRVNRQQIGMRFGLRLGLLVSIVLFVACEHETMVSDAPPAKQVAQIPGGSEPVVRKGNPYNAKLLRDAMRGLDYDNDRVTINQVEARRLVKKPNAERAALVYEEAISLLYKNRVVDAIKNHTLAVLLDPESSQYYTGLGHAFIVKRKHAFARAAFQTALDINPNDIRARFLLADVLNRDGEYENSLVEMERVLELDADYPQAHNKMAIWSYYMGDTEAAKVHLNLARQLGDRVPPQFETILSGDPIRQPQSRGVSTIVFGPEARNDVNNPQPGNETTASSNAVNPNEVITGWNDYRNNIKCGIGVSTDYGETFSDVLIRPPVAFQTSVEGDPMTCFDNRTGRMWAGAIAFGNNGGIYAARKEPGATTFEPSVMIQIAGGIDKGWMAAGPDPFNNNETRVYCAYNFGVAFSTDEGDTWSAPTSYQEFALGVLPRIGPNGELYIGYWDFDDGIKMFRSLDGGQTLQLIEIAQRMDIWGIDGTRFPGEFRVASLTSLAVDPNDGTLYVTYPDTTSVSGGQRNVDIYFCKSTDQGDTWTTPVVINGDGTPPGDQFFPWIEVDERGRIHMLSYDTRMTPGVDDVSPAIIEAYYTYSDDGGDSWTELILTEQPFSSANDGFGDGFIGDYLGIGIGRCYAYPVYLSTHEGTSNVYVRRVTDEISVGPSAVQKRVGQLVSGGTGNLGASDDSYLVYRSSKPGTAVVRNPNAVPQPFVWLEFVGTNAGDDPCELRFAIESSSSLSNVEQTISLFDYESESWQLVEVAPSTTADSTTTVAIQDEPGRFVGPGNEVKARVEWRKTSLAGNSRFNINVDSVTWTDLTTNR